MGGRLRFCSLASSSVHGNAYFVEAVGGDGFSVTRILVDCGLPLRRLEASLAGLGVDPAGIDAVLITHEHTDHIHSLRIRIPFPQRYRIPVYAPAACWRAMAPRTGPIDAGLRRHIEAGEELRVGPVSVRALAKSHDAADPVGFILTTGGERLAVVTDLGTVDSALFAALRGAEYLVFESNHDVEMQWAADRPFVLKQRVLSHLGHLSNDQAAGVLAQVATESTRLVLLAHLSIECNRPELARRAVAARLSGVFRGSLEVAPPAIPSTLFGGCGGFGD